MSKNEMATYQKNMFYTDVIEAIELWKQIRNIEKEYVFALALLYQIGVIHGKRQDRARRKGGALV